MTKRRRYKVLSWFYLIQPMRHIYIQRSHLIQKLHATRSLCGRYIVCVCVSLSVCMRALFNSKYKLSISVNGYIFYIPACVDNTLGKIGFHLNFRHRCSFHTLHIKGVHSAITCYSSNSALSRIKRFETLIITSLFSQSHHIETKNKQFRVRVRGKKSELF